jgi:DNA-binding XRE family transcriptional regulator
MGLDRPAAAKLLHVSERTVRNWETGVHEIPYTAYKLLRLLSYSELPGAAWSGWHIAVGRLWSPEGYSFAPQDAAWWSNLCRRAQLFHVLYDENNRLRAALADRSAAGRASDALPVPTDGRIAGFWGESRVTPHLSLKNETFAGKRPTAPTPTTCPARVRYNLPKALLATTVKGGRA